MKIKMTVAVAGGRQYFFVIEAHDLSWHEGDQLFLASYGANNTSLLGEHHWELEIISLSAGSIALQRSGMPYVEWSHEQRPVIAGPFSVTNLDAACHLFRLWCVTIVGKLENLFSSTGTCLTHPCLKESDFFRSLQWLYNIYASQTVLY